MTWAEFKQAAPGLAEKAESLFDASGIVMVGTIRKDGSPRISPVEVLITDGKLYLGMMWQSLKARSRTRLQPHLNSRVLVEQGSGAALSTAAKRPNALPKAGAQS